MQDQNTKTVAALQAAKQKGLSYYDAVQSLKDQGFTQDDIDDASDHFDYQQGRMRSLEQESPAQAHTEEKKELAQQEEELTDQERQDRLEEEKEGLNRFI